MTTQDARKLIAHLGGFTLDTDTAAPPATHAWPHAATVRAWPHAATVRAWPHAATVRAS
jgi:hypothetical protein